MGPIGFAALVVGSCVVLLIAVAVALRLRKLLDQRRYFAQAEAAFHAGRKDEAYRLYREGYIVTFEGDADAVRTLDQRAMVGRVRELFQAAGKAEPPGLAALAELAEKDLIRNPSTRFGTKFRRVPSSGRTRSSARMKSPLRAGSSSRTIDARRLLRAFVPKAQPYGFFADLSTPAMIEEAIGACEKEDLREVVEAAAFRDDHDPIVRLVMLELDPLGARNIDTESIFTSEDLVLMLQEIVPLARGPLAAGGAAALIDLANSKAQLSLQVKGTTKIFEVGYRGSRLDRVELIKALNRLLEEAGAPRRYGLFDTGANDLETACLEPAHWEAIERDAFLPLVRL